MNGENVKMESETHKRKMNDTNATKIDIDGNLIIIRRSFSDLVKAHVEGNGDFKRKQCRLIFWPLQMVLATGIPIGHVHSLSFLS